jgi:phosphoribosyl 1,2-cyclic phosphate phosphodiesterase
MTKVIFLGAGAAPGVPSISCGWGNCNPDNPKNIRTRTSTYYEINGVNILVDTSPDLRQQMLDNDICAVDCVLYTHSHFDHISGIDELREFNRRTCKPMPVFASRYTMAEIKRKYDYMIIKDNEPNFYYSRGGLVPQKVKANNEFYFGGIKIMPLKLLGHNVPSYGYIINDEIVHLGDFKVLSNSAIKQINKIKPKLMVVPLTVPTIHKHHVGLEEALNYVKMFDVERVVFNHMASECDYDCINESTPDYVTPAYDGMKLEW